MALEEQKRKHLQLECALEKERTAVSELRQSIDSEKALHKAELSQERSRITELQIVLDAEKTRACELNSAFEQECQISKQLQSAEKTQEAMPNPSGKSSELLLLELQKQVNDQRNRTVELVSEMEKYKLESFQLRQRLEEQQQIHRKSLLKEQESHRLVLEKVDSLQLQAKELLQQLEKEKHEVLKLQREKGKLKETLLALHGTDQVRSERAAERRSEMDVPQTEVCSTSLITHFTIFLNKSWITSQVTTCGAWHTYYKTISICEDIAKYFSGMYLRGIQASCLIIWIFVVHCAGHWILL